MRLLLTLLVCISLTSCSVVYSGVIKNNYPDFITVDSAYGVSGNTIVSATETTEIPIFAVVNGTCFTVTSDTEAKNYFVPAPPSWSKISGVWDVKFGISVSAQGAYYIGKNSESQKLDEVPSCDT